MSPITNAAAVAITESSVMTATPEAVDTIHHLRRTNVTLQPDFGWTPQNGSSYNYPWTPTLPETPESGALKMAYNTALTFTANVVVPIGSPLKVVAYEWDMGDGKRLYGPTVTYTFTARANSGFDHRRITLCITDNRGHRTCVGKQALFYVP